MFFGRQHDSDGNMNENQWPRPKLKQTFTKTISCGAPAYVRRKIPPASCYTPHWLDSGKRFPLLSALRHIPGFFNWKFSTRHWFVEFALNWPWPNLDRYDWRPRASLLADIDTRWTARPRKTDPAPVLKDNRNRHFEHTFLYGCSTNWWSRPTHILLALVARLVSRSQRACRSRKDVGSMPGCIDGNW